MVYLSGAGLPGCPGKKAVLFKTDVAAAAVAVVVAGLPNVLVAFSILIRLSTLSFQCSYVTS